jgi:hypothetical protein
MSSPTGAARCYPPACATARSYAGVPSRVRAEMPNVDLLSSRTFRFFGLGACRQSNSAHIYIRYLNRVDL